MAERGRAGRRVLAVADAPADRETPPGPALGPSSSGRAPSTAPFASPHSPTVSSTGPRPDAPGTGTRRDRTVGPVQALSGPGGSGRAAGAGAARGLRPTRDDPLAPGRSGTGDASPVRRARTPPPPRGTPPCGPAVGRPCRCRARDGGSGPRRVEPMPRPPLGVERAGPSGPMVGRRGWWCVVRRPTAAPAPAPGSDARPRSGRGRPRAPSPRSTAGGGRAPGRSPTDSAARATCPNRPMTGPDPDLGRWTPCRVHGPKAAPAARCRSVEPCGVRRPIRPSSAGGSG